LHNPGEKEREIGLISAIKKETNTTLVETVSNKELNLIYSLEL